MTYPPQPPGWQQPQPPPMPPVPPPMPVMRNISHGAHFIATILTVGLWAPFWFIASVNTSRLNRKRQLQYAEAMARYEYDRTEYNRWRDRMEGR